MANKDLLGRLDAIRRSLMCFYEAGKNASSATKGREREILVEGFLSQAFPPPFRFGTGDIIDTANNRSGQVDIVVEYPFLPSIPTHPGSPRLYLAEGVAAAIEVKSDISAQFQEVKDTANRLAVLRRQFPDFEAGSGGISSDGTMASGPLKPQIPLFAVGFKGWRDAGTLRGHLADGLDGILVVETGLFASSTLFGQMEANGGDSLWGLVSCLHMAMSSLKALGFNPVVYTDPEQEET
jgi:hypothetical protein